MVAVKLDEFTRAYVECALWAENDESTPQGGEPFDANYSIDDIAPESIETMAEECRKFQADNAADLSEAYGLYKCVNSTPAKYAGHDFWLTRNGHGCGFWDRDLGDVGERLTRAAHACGCRDLYIGDDGKVWQYPG